MVLTHVYVKRRQENAVEMGVKFCADYAENAAKENGEEEVYIDGKGEMLVITKGMNQKLADVHVGISSTEGAEAWLVEKLLAFAKLYGTKIDFGWPEALAVAQALDPSVLANRIPFAKKPVRKEQSAQLI